jgi:hypothetical protein
MLLEEEGQKLARIQFLSAKRRRTENKRRRTGKGLIEDDSQKEK